MPSASDILVKIGADIGEFKKAMDEAKKQTTGLGKEFDSFAEKTSKISGVFSSIGKSLMIGLSVPFVAAATGAVALANKAGEAADKLLDLEQITGMSTTRLQEMEFVAAEAGSNFEGLVGVMTKFTGKLSGIEEDSGSAAEAMRMLGVQINDSNGNLKDADDLFPEIIKSLQNVTNVTERNSLAQKVFGKSLGDLAPILGYTNAEFDELIKNAHAAGVVMSKEDLVAADNFRAEMDKLKLSFDKSLVSLGGALIPMLRDTLVSAMGTATEAINSFREWWSGLEEDTQESIVTFAAVVAAIGPVLIVIGKMISAFQAAAIVVGAAKLAMAGQALATGASTAALVTHKIVTVAATVATAAFNAVLAVNPAVIVLGAIAALGVGLYALSKRTNDNTEAEKKAAAQKDILKAATEGLTDASDGQMEITRRVTAAWERQGVSVGEQIKNLKKNIKDLQDVSKHGNKDEAALKSYSDMIKARNSEIKRLEQGQQQESTNKRKAYNAELIKEKEEANKKYTEIVEKSGKTEFQMIKMECDKEINELKVAHQRGLVDEILYQEAKLVIIQKYEKKYDDTYTKSWQDKLNEAANWLNMFGDAISDAGSIIDGFYENDMERVDQNLEKKLESLDAWKEAQLAQYEEEEESELGKQERQLSELEGMLAKSTNSKDQAALKEAITEKKKSVNKLKIESEYDKKKAKLEADADKRTREIKREQAKTDKAIAIFNAVINTAASIMQALANMAPPMSYVMAAISGVMGAAEIALIAAEPLPLASGALAKAGAGGTDVKLAEVGYDEAILPLSPQVFERLGDGIISALMKKVNQVGSAAGNSLFGGNQQIVVEQHITMQGADVSIDSEKIGSIATRMFRNRLILVDSGAVV